jgi:hypothetical protein
MRTYVKLMNRWRRNREVGFRDPKPSEPMSVEERKVYCMLSKDERAKFRAQRAEEAVARSAMAEESESEETSVSEEKDEETEDAGYDIDAVQQKTITGEGELGKRESEVEQKKRNMEGVGAGEVSCNKKEKMTRVNFD